MVAVCSLQLCALAAVAQIRTPPIHRATPVTADLLILRSGEVKKGVVKVCDEDVCTLGTVSYTRQQIAWIELGAQSTNPPAVGDASRDEVHLSDGSTQTGRFVGLSLGEVDLDSAAYDREKVTWIHFAGAPGATPGEEAPPPQPAPPPPPPPPRTQPQPEPQRQPPPQPQPQPQPATQPRGPNREPVEPCPADKPLGGLVILKFEGNDSMCIGTTRLVMRFPLVPKKEPGARWTEILWTGFYAPEITYTLSSGGCSKLLGNGEECHAPGGLKRGKLDAQSLISLAEGSRRTTGSGYLDFEPREPRLDFSVVPTEMHDGFTTAMECIEHDVFGNPHTHVSRWTVWTPNFIVIGAASSCESFRFCVPQAECGGSRPNLAKCTSHMERYAVLPFEGQSSWKSASGHDSFLSTSIQWHVCCGCAALPTPPEPSTDNCPSTEQADADAEHNRQKREAKASALEESWKEFQKDMAAAQSHRADLDTTLAQCGFQETVTNILLLSVGVFGPGGAYAVSEGGAEAAGVVEALESGGANPEEVKEFFELLGKIPGPYSMMGEVVEKSIAGEDPTVAVAPNEHFQEIAKLLDAADWVKNYLDGGSTDKLEERVESCAKTINLSYETWNGAKQYVEDTKEAMNLLPGIHTLVNDIRQLDVDYPDLQYKAWAACVLRARCMGTPESDCDSKKPAGNWPPVK